METKIKTGYRHVAFDAYRDDECAYCGFGIKAVLEVAHLDQNRTNNLADNLAVLCPTCHKMHDINLIPTEVIRQMRDHKKEANWGSRMKDAAVKAGATRKENTAKKLRSIIAKKAVATRKENAVIKLKEVVSLI